MRVCRLWRKIGTDLGFVADGKVWRFDKELCELRRVVPYDDREAIWDPRVQYLKLGEPIAYGRGSHHAYTSFGDDGDIRHYLVKVDTTLPKL